jgi:uncharacterized protein
MNARTPVPPPDEAIAPTHVWIEPAVIGPRLCPFAQAVDVKGQNRYVVGEAQTSVVLLDDLARELRILVAASLEEVDKTLLVHPRVLTDCLFHKLGVSTAGAAQQRSIPPQSV